MHNKVWWVIFYLFTPRRIEDWTGPLINKAISARNKKNKFFWISISNPKESIMRRNKITFAPLILALYRWKINKFFNIYFFLLIVTLITKSNKFLWYLCIPYIPFHQIKEKIRNHLFCFFQDGFVSHIWTIYPWSSPCAFG